MSTGTPIDVVLEAFRRWKSEAYVCCPNPDRNHWRADCPACLRPREIRISEHGEGGPVAMRCLACRASQDRIVEALLVSIDRHATGRSA